ncbi:hypothetical protein M0802_007758 [Mischocyttarus mexicanus]|nr:hypothetical protein M0802_007758 [Mischocyttarus mexicanus]
MSRLLPNGGRTLKRPRRANLLGAGYREDYGSTYKKTTFDESSKSFCAEHYSFPVGKPTAVKVQFVTSVARAVAPVVARIVAIAVTRDCLAHCPSPQSDRGPIAQIGVGAGVVQSRDSHPFFNDSSASKTINCSLLECSGTRSFPSLFGRREEVEKESGPCQQLPPLVRKNGNCCGLDGAYETIISYYPASDEDYADDADDAGDDDADDDDDEDKRERRKRKDRRVIEEEGGKRVRGKTQRGIEKRITPLGDRLSSLYLKADRRQRKARDNAYAWEPWCVWVRVGRE